MVTISTSEDIKPTTNCVTPKKKLMAAATSTNSNSTPAAAVKAADNSTDQTAPNILVYRKV